MVSLRVKGLVGIFAALSLFIGALFAQYPPNRYDAWRGYGGYGGYDPRVAKVERMKQIRDSLVECRQERDTIIREIRRRNPNAEESDFQQDREQGEEYRDVMKRIKALTTPSDAMGTAIARAFAGNDWDAFSDVTITSPTQGFTQGVTFKTCRVLSDFVGDKVESTVKRLLGPTWDAALDKVVELAGDAKSVLFHQSKDPFTSDELKNWSDVIGSGLDGFGKLIKGRVEFESRSKDMNSRAFDSEDQSTVNQDQVIAERLLKHYAMQCDYYAQLIDKRKGYYKEDSEIVFIADQLKDWLIEFKNIVLSIKSLKDVSAKFGSNITMITETAMNIRKLFEKLGVLVTPASSTFNDRSTKRTPSTYADTSSRRDYAGRYGAGGDSDFPQQYAGGYDY